MAEDDPAMDSMFNAFMNEVTSIKSSKMKKIEDKAGTPDELVERLTTTVFESAYQVLILTPEATESEVTKQYRRLSVLIHPDKCKLDGASEAFQVLSKAYAQTKDVNYVDKYIDIVGPARTRVRKRREAENVKREKKGEDPLPTEGNEFDREVLEECEAMTTVGKEDREERNAVLEANLKRHSDMRRDAGKSKREEENTKKKWDKNRDKRVAGWQIFMNNVETKKFRTETWGKVGHVGAGNAMFRQEERTELQSSNGPKVSEGETLPMGVSKDYKKVWR